MVAWRQSIDNTLPVAIIYATGDLTVWQLEICALRVINRFSDRREKRSRLCLKVKDENDGVLEKRIFLVGFGAELVSHDHYTALGSDYLLSLALILFFGLCA